MEGRRLYGETAPGKHFSKDSKRNIGTLHGSTSNACGSTSNTHRCKRPNDYYSVLLYA